MNWAHKYDVALLERYIDRTLSLKLRTDSCVATNNRWTIFVGSKPLIGLSKNRAASERMCRNFMREVEGLKIEGVEFEDALD